MIPLENLMARPLDGRNCIFEIYPTDPSGLIKAAKFDSQGAVLLYNHSSYVLKCASQEEMNDWLEAIQAHILDNPFSELIQRKLLEQKRLSTKTRAKSEFTPTPLKSALSDLKINFKNLYELAILCSLTYKSEQEILDHCGPNTYVRSIGQKFFYFVTLNNDTREQFIVLGSSNWTSLRSLKKDYRFWLKNQTTQKDHQKDPFTFYKLEGTALQLFSNIKGYLKFDYSTTLTGHSLFSVTCTEVADLLAKSGYEIAKVVTFGQPRIFSKNSHDNQAFTFPIFRVIDLKDPVNALFPNFIAPGPEVILLSGKYHTNADNQIREQPELPKNLTDYLGCHSIHYYMERIKQKIKESILVSYQERFKYQGGEALIAANIPNTSLSPNPSISEIEEKAESE